MTINEIKNQLINKNELTLNDIPEIDLYMDQVIQLFERKYHLVKRNKTDKILTKTMINNYAKAKLLPDIHKKKYTKEHLIFISLIYQLKSTLSIQDIKIIFDIIYQKINVGTVGVEDFYQQHLDLLNTNKQLANENISRIERKISEKLTNLNNEDDQLMQAMLVVQLSSISDLYRRLAEKLVDELQPELPQGDKKQGNN